ncbi:MAG: alpha/beta hydrolase [Acidimicrobiales bacterium]
MTGPRRRRAAVTLVAVAVVAGGCASHPESSPKSTTTTSSRTPTSRPSATRPTVGTSTTTPASTTSTTLPLKPLTWSPCDDGFECTTLAVPVDYADPGGPTLELAMVRRPAHDPARRVGTLFMNPGGPGGSAIDLVEASALPTEVTDRFDVIGFDPRGVGRSTPLDCRRHLQQIYDDDPTIDSAADRNRLLADSKAFVAECKTKYRDLLPHLGSRDVARDMDRIRAALGDKRINYVGYSYGTVFGQTYAAMFPKRVRTMVLDGVVDLSVDGLGSAEGQAAGFNGALEAFSAFCDSGETCELPGPAADVIDEVIADSEARPIPGRGAGGPANPGVVSLALAQALYSESLWPQLARALDQGQAGNGSGLVRLADAYLRRNADGTYPNGFEIYFATTCLDQAFPRDPQRLLDVAKVIGVKYPRFGEALVGDYVRCALWPVPAQPLRPVPPTTRHLPPIVVVSTTGDPATPWINGVRVAEQIPHAVLVTNVGKSHTIYAQGKACIDDPVTAYLADAKAPARGLVCP